jgi:4-diphosphocytidyl-2-C-methyl-D-erythritol kinase
MSDAPRTATVAAHAKVNLALRILAREAGGHHQLETDFHRLALADDVTVTLVDEPGIVLASDVAFDVPPEQNLAVRAAAAYQAAARWPLARGIAIGITKRIPMGGGLGGGSADAGAVLRALDALNPHPIGVEARVRIATPLGADVPFLATTAPRVLAWGRGERMLALPALAGITVHLACFDTGVNTAHAYGWLAAARAEAPTAPEGALLDPATLADFGGVRARATNAFEPVVAARRDDVRGVLAAWRDVLAEAEACVLLSGSGATVFAAVHGTGHGDALAAAAVAHGARHVRTTLLDRVAGVACRA